MTPLTNEQFATAQRFCQLMSEKIAAVGLDVYVESNFRDFIRLRTERGPDSIKNPSFDPEHNDLSLHNAFWLRVVDTMGETVAMIAHRVIDTDNFLDELTSLRLWHDKMPRLIGVLHPLGCEFADGMAGRIGHAGGLWVDRRYRKRNLSGYLDHLSRGLALRNFWVDHITGNIATPLAATGIGLKQYGLSHFSGPLDFDFFVPGQKVAFVIGYMDRAEALERMHRWLLLPDCNSVEELEEVAAKVLVA